MSSNHNAILSALSGHLLHVNANVNTLTGNFGKLKLAIGSALAIGAGVTILDTMGKLIQSTKEYSDELAKLQTLGGGMSKAVVSGEIARKAFDISQRIPMKVEDLMKIPGASYSILGQEDSMKVWEKLAQFQWVMQNQKDFKGDAGDDMSKFLRSGELSGRLTDPTTHKAAIEELTRFLDLSQKVMAATHGMVTPSTMLGMAQQAGFSMRDMTDEGFMNMAIMSQAMGGPRAGTAMLSLYNQVATGKMTKPAAIGMQDLGLLGADEWKSDHGHVIISPQAEARLGKLLGKNPMDFVDKIYENLEKQGVTDPEEQKRRVAAAMSRQTSERFVIEQMMNRQQMAAERERMSQGMGSSDAAGIYGAKSITANEEALYNAWHNLQVAVAGPQSERVIEVLQKLTAILNSMQSSVTGMNPETIGLIAKVIAGMAAAIVVIGGISLLALTSVPVLIAGAVAAIAAFIALDWGGLTEHFKKLLGVLGAPFGIDPAEGGSHPGRDGKPWHKDKTRFDPGQAPIQATPISLSLNVDGRTLAQVVSDKLDALYRYDTSAPAFSGAGRYGA